jgi:hypothetical protein
MKLQACIGSRMSIMHIRDTETTKCMNGDLVLCGGTVAFHDYKRRLRRSLICSKCLRLSGCQALVDLAPFIGVTEII